MAIDRLFQLMKDKNASDMFLSVNSALHLKINGKLVPINAHKLEENDVRTLLAEVCTPLQMATLERDNELNIGIPVDHLGRFRLSAFRQRGNISAVFRFVPGNIPALSELDLPAVLADLIMEKHGLILIAGATGSGKSTTIASILDYRNGLRTGHILTLEDPIEFLFKNQHSIVNQREIGSDVVDFQTGLRNSMRQAPDCILIGEIRDHETMVAALAYAQSGNLVLATLHANNSYNALHRIISFYPLENRAALLQDLASTLKAIVSQRLMQSSDGASRKAAVEVMINTLAISELIGKGEIAEIRGAIDKSLSPGSQSFDMALLKLVRAGLVSQQEALSNADSATNLLWLLNNGPARRKTEAEPAPGADESFSKFTLDT
ncbi:MAG: twitching motility protein PilU [Janthinobacterium sp.]|jgi:twitching motility protein PilU